MVPVGRKFGRLEVLGEGERKYFWICECRCGTRVEVKKYKVLEGTTASCGCLQRELAGGRCRTHGLSDTPEYKAWRGMKYRCTNPRCKSYRDYGARGIKVCRRWMRFENFIIDMGSRPSTKHTIERKDNSKGYEPRNCVWATRLEQNRNRRSVRVYTYGGKKLNLAGWASELGVAKSAMYRRAKAGLPPSLMFMPKSEFRRVRCPRGERVASKLNEKSVRKIRHERAAGASAAQLADKYGISESMVRSVATRKSWAHVD